MGTTRFISCLDTLGWHPNTMALKCGIPAHETRAMAAGRLPVRQDVADWLEALAAAHERFSAPVCGGNA